MEDSTVDRNAETKENDEVDRVGVDLDEVDRNKSTQEEESSGITFHIHPVPEGKSALLKGFQPPKMLSPSMRVQVNQGVIFGRAADVNIFLNDDTASRKHMELTALIVPTSFNFQQLQFKIKNICQRSLQLNNFNLTPGEERFINTRDILKIGQLTFTMEINPNNVYDNNTRYLLEFKQLLSMVPVPQQPPVLHGHVIPPRPSQLHYDATGMQTFGLSQPHMPNDNMMQPSGFIHSGVVMQQPSGGPRQGIPHANFMPASQPYMANVQPAGLAIFPTSFPQQFPHQGNAPGPGCDYNNPTQPAPQRANVSQFSPAVNPRGQEHIHVDAQDRREMFSQNAERSPSENEEFDCGKPHSLSVEETQPPKLSSETSFEETQPPKM